MSGTLAFAALLAFGGGGARAAEGSTAEIAAGPTVAGPTVAGPVVDRVAAAVNDEIVTLSEVYEFGGAYIAEGVGRAGEAERPKAELEVLERLIERRLVSQEMAALKLDLNEQELDRSIDDIARRNGLDRDGLRVEVERSGMGWDQYRGELRENLRDMKFAQSVLRPRVTVTEDELRDTWRRTAQNAAPTAHILALFLAFPKDADEAARAAVLARAEALRAEAVAGAEFAELSRKHDEGSFGAEGGEMGSYAPGQLIGELDTAVVATPTGTVSAPVVLGQGVFLLYVADRQAAAGDFEAMRPKLEDEVFLARMEDEKERWFQQARRRAAVRILLPSVPGAPEAAPPQ